MKPPDVLDYAVTPPPVHSPAPKVAARVSLACAGLFVLALTGLFDKSVLPLCLPPVGIGAAIVSLVQACSRGSDPAPAALGLVLNAASAAFIGYLCFTD